jgi:hypothetical protein
VSQLGVLDHLEDTVKSRSANSPTNWPSTGHEKSDRSRKDARTNFALLEKLRPAPAFTAHSVEFVAAPSEACRVRLTIPADIDTALGVVDGYAGCMVLVSDQEARLVTVITLWNGADRVRRCNENAKWVKRLLTPYVDRWLRTQTLITSLKGSQQFPLGVCR